MPLDDKSDENNNSQRFDPSDLLYYIDDPASMSSEILTEKTMPSLVMKNLQYLNAQTLAILPQPFEWCWVEGGDVTLQYMVNMSRKNRRIGVQRKIRYKVKSFWMAKYPITHAQYEVFVNALDGYTYSQWWEFSKIAAFWRANRSQPYSQLYEGDDLPRTSLMWYESMAFGNWLSNRLGLDVTLPTEEQWQRAAIGDTEWIYPWGDEIDSTFCNYDGNIGQPTPVTQYSLGASPYGVYDLSGNVWEWTLTSWRTGKNNTYSGHERIIRGGSFKDNDNYTHAVSRSRQFPDACARIQGFRIVCNTVGNDPRRLFDSEIF